MKSCLSNATIRAAVSHFLRPDTQVAISYGATAYSVAVINNIWVSYVYAFFATGPLAAGPWFVGVQLIFLVWNASNDAFFGWLSDTSTVLHGRIGRRLPRIRTGGRLLSVSFVFAWFPWSSEGGFIAALHFLFALCLYDAALTYVEVNYASLLADITDSSELRALCNSYASLFSVLGSLSSFFAYLMWRGGEDLATFRLFCIVVAVLALPGFEFSHHRLHRLDQQRRRTRSDQEEAEQQQQQQQQQQLAAIAANASNTGSAGSVAVQIHQLRVESGQSSSPRLPPQQKQKPAFTFFDFRVFIRQLSRQTNFAVFVVIRLLQVFSCTFEKNHLAMFLQKLAGQQVAEAWLGFLVSLSFILPHLCLLLATAFISRSSLYDVIRGLFVTKGCLAMLTLFSLLVAGSGAGAEPSALLVVAYFCAGRVVTECICRLFPLVTSELVDEDRALHSRSQSMAASIVGMSALVAKPGESFAPILGWWLLRSFGPLREAAQTVTASASQSPAVVTSLLDSGVVPLNRFGKPAPHIAYIHPKPKITAKSASKASSPANSASASPSAASAAKPSAAAAASTPTVAQSQTQAHAPAPAPAPAPAASRSPLASLHGKAPPKISYIQTQAKAGSKGALADGAALHAADGGPAHGMSTTATGSGATNSSLLFILLLIPILVAAAQFLLWSYYSLRGSYLRDVKNRLASMRDSTSSSSEETASVRANGVSAAASGAATASGSARPRHGGGQTSPHRVHVGVPLSVPASPSAEASDSEQEHTHDHHGHQHEHDHAHAHAHAHGPEVFGSAGLDPTSGLAHLRHPQAHQQPHQHTHAQPHWQQQPLMAVHPAYTHPAHPQAAYAYPAAPAAETMPHAHAHAHAQAQAQSNPQLQQMLAAELRLD